MAHGKKRIPYWIDLRLTGLAGPEYHAIISFGLPPLSLKTPNMGNTGLYHFVLTATRNVHAYYRALALEVTPAVLGNQRCPSAVNGSLGSPNAPCPTASSAATRPRALSPLSTPDQISEHRLEVPSGLPFHIHPPEQLPRPAPRGAKTISLAVARCKLPSVSGYVIFLTY